MVEQVIRRGSLVALAAALALTVVGCANRAPMNNNEMAPTTTEKVDTQNEGTFVNAKERISCSTKKARHHKKRHHKMTKTTKSTETKTTEQKTSQNEQTDQQPADAQQAAGQHS